jgi:hypothetical protein
MVDWQRERESLLYQLRDIYRDKLAYINARIQAHEQHLITSLIPKYYHCMYVILSTCTRHC